MLIAKVQDNQVLEVADYAAMFPDTSFPANGPDAEWMIENSCLPVTVFLPHDETQKLIPAEPYILDGVVYTVVVESKTAEELQADVDSKSAKVRSERNAKLAETDWTQLADAPVDPAVWAAYRQELRDVTKQPNFPTFIVWPVKP